MALRCASGEFGGSAWKAAGDPECLSLGVDESSIRYYIKKINPTEAAACAAERERVAAEAAAAVENGRKVQFVFVERVGARPAEKALTAVLETIEKNVSTTVTQIVDHARHQGRIERQSELESDVLKHEEAFNKAEAKFKASVEALKTHWKKSADQEADAHLTEALRTAERLDRIIEELKAKRDDKARQAEKAEAKIIIAKDKLSGVRETVWKLRRALASSRRKVKELEELQQRPPPSSTVPVYDEEDVEDLETIIGDLTAKLKEFEGNERECARNRQEVANMKAKFRERLELKEELKAKEKTIEVLQKEVGDLRAMKVREPRFKIERDPSKTGRPYDPYFVVPPR